MFQFIQNIQTTMYYVRINVRKMESLTIGVGQILMRKNGTNAHHQVCIANVALLLSKNSLRNLQKIFVWQMLFFAQCYWQVFRIAYFYHYRTISLSTNDWKYLQREKSTGMQTLGGLKVIRKFVYCDVCIRVANVVAHHEKLLTQWRYRYVPE